ncbi:MAG: DNA translocase FtsK 4TM domain-containing protein [Nitrospinae bacterium]|nr:DNA translocase FtsK 4TM domain-containing protein [Nitrospinota bacterium]
MAGKRHVREGFGVGLIAFALLAVISLVSYSVNDPSFSHAVSGGGAVQNAAGVIGAYLSDSLVQMFGAAVYAIPVFCLALGIMMFWENAKVFALSLIAGGMLFFVSFCSLVNIIWPQDPIYATAYGGGFVGYLFAEKFLVAILARAGAGVIAFALLFVAALVTTRMSFGQFFRITWDASKKVWDFARETIFPAIAALIARLRKQPQTEKGEEPAAVDAPEIVKQPAAAPPEKTPSAEAPKIVKREQEKPKKGSEEEFKVLQADFGFVQEGMYALPPLSYLADPKPSGKQRSEKEMLVNAQILTKKLADFDIDGRVTQVLPGPVITQYEFEPAPGVKVSKITALADDLAMGLRATSVRILAPVPGKAVVGVEVPNAHVEPVYLKDILTASSFTESESKLTISLGKDTGGTPVAADLAKMPHLLIAGSTGSGKSVGVNAMIMSILFKARPDEVNFIMVDPKMLELSIYDGIPHLISPVVTNPKKAANALRWAVNEMDRRYALLADKGFRNITGYNEWAQEQLDEEAKKAKRRKKEKDVEVRVQRFDEDGEMLADVIEEEAPVKKLPFIVIIIDELADLMLVASKEVEDSLARLAQMARASGIHLILATQRPSVDVLTGLIKANFPTRLSYQVTSRIDSRTILDSMGAEKLLGKGDLLFLPPGSGRLQRIHGPFVSDDEVKRVVEFVKKQGKPQFNEEILKMQEKADLPPGAEDEGMGDDEEFFEQAVELVALTRQASISMVQRRLRIGYNRAARIIETMEQRGMVGPADGAKPRQVLIPAPPGKEELGE